jgi:predicted GIY-YIG superfamily endonuclease
MKLAPENWTHYLYVIRFVDGFYYTGVSKRKGDNPACDRYFGSCLNKSKWFETMYEKEIVAYLWLNTHEEAYSAEEKWQKLSFRLKDHFCLNKHFGSTNFKEEASRNGGRMAGKNNVEKRRGFWREDLLLIRSETCRQGGLKGGKSAVETGQLAKARETAWKNTSKATALICLCSGEITIYPSLNEAARAINGSAGALCSVIKGFRKSHKGFKAKYVSG